MGFSIRLANEEATVEPGSSVPVAFEIVNEGEKEEEFEVSLEGLDPEWAAIPVPTMWVGPGETKVDRVFIKPPRESESKAGIYPYVIRVRAMDSGESKTEQSSLSVNSFSNVSIEATPKRATVTVLNRSAPFEVTVMNLGNTEENLQLYASDVDDLIAFDFATNQISLAPGQSRVVEMTATGSKVKALQGMQLAPVTVSTRSSENPSVAANCQIHVEVRPVISAGPLIAVFVVIAMLVGWVLSIPKPPVVNSYSIQPRSVMVGEPIEVLWETSHATSVSIIYGSVTYEKQPADGSLQLQTDQEGKVEIQIIAYSGDIQSEPVRQEVEVTVQPTVPDAKILAFSANRKEVPLGSSVVLEYRLNDAVTYAYLEPIGQIEPKANSIQVPSPPDDLPGKGVKTMTYTLIARNAQGKEVSKKIEVRFVKDSKAVISRFEANPLEVDPLAARTTLRWQVTNATRLELHYGDRKDELTAMDDRRDFILTDDTTFTLIAFDAQGLETRKVITVKMKEPEVPVDPPVDTTGSTGGVTTGTTGSTTGTAGSTTGITTRPGGGNRR